MPENGERYKQNMGDVDLSDMYESLYEIDRKSKKGSTEILGKLLIPQLQPHFILFKERVSAKGKSAYKSSIY